MLQEKTTNPKKTADGIARIHGVDALRGLAASGVVIVHAVSMRPLEVPFYSWSVGYLVLGVPLFFIISAFSMTIAYPTGIDDVSSARRYAIRRFLRIAPLFYVMLTAWILYYRHVGSPFPELKTLFLNISFLFGLVPKAQVSLVPAGWSIGIEMLFYLLLPIIWIRRGFRVAAMILLLAFAGAWFVNQSVSTEVRNYFYWTHFATNAPYFAIGLTVWCAYMSIAPSGRLRWGMSSLALGIGLGVLMFLYGPEVSGQRTRLKPVPLEMILGWGTAFGLIVFSQALSPVKLLVNPITRFLGKISYSLYLSHPLLIFSTKITVWAAALAPNQYLVVPFVALATLFCAIPLAWLLYAIVEKPFIRLGRKLTKKQLKPALFLHIQKTAGTSVQAMARKHYGNQSVISHADYAHLGPEGCKKIPFVSGHFGMEFSKSLIENRYSFVFLRDPIERLISYYVYCLNAPIDESFSSRMAKSVDMISFFDDAHGEAHWSCIWNHQSSQLAWGWGHEAVGGNAFYPWTVSDGRVLEAAKSNLAIFDYVGFVDTFNTDIKSIFKNLGVPPNEIDLVHNNKSQIQFKYSELPSDVRAKLMDLTRIDRMLYEYAINKYGSKNQFINIARKIIRRIRRIKF